MPTIILLTMQAVDPGIVLDQLFYLTSRCHQCQLNINPIPTQRDADLVEQEFYELVHDRSY